MTARPMKWLSTFDSRIPWPTTLVVGLLHGNEPIWLRFRDALEEAVERKTFFGKILFLIGNPEAAAHGLRFVDRDLNRCFWTPTGFEREWLRAREIRDFLAATHLDYVFDIHSTPTKSDPMTICVGDDASLELAERFPIGNIVIGLDRILEGRPLGALLVEEFSVPNLAFECWQHEQPESFDIADGIFEAILNVQNGKNGWKMGRHGRIRVTDALKASSKDFVFSKNFEGFEVIAPNETIATQRGETISFPTEKVIVIPRPDALSELDKKSEVIVGYLGEFIR